MAAREMRIFNADSHVWWAALQENCTVSGAFCIGTQGQTETMTDLQGCIMAAGYGILYRSDHGRNPALCSTKYEYHQHDGLLREIGRKSSSLDHSIASIPSPDFFSDTPHCFPLNSAGISALRAKPGTSRSSPRGLLCAKARNPHHSHFQLQLLVLG